MKKALSALTLFVVLCGALSTSLPAFAVSVGGACTKIGATTNLGKLTLVCTVVAKKKVWKAKPAPTTVKYWASACDFDTDIAAEWKDVQTYLSSIGACQAPYKVIPTSLSSLTPKTSLVNNDARLPIDRCKLQNQRGTSLWTGFPSAQDISIFQGRKFPGPNTRFQVIAVQPLDAADPRGTPSQEYGKYFAYIKNVLEYISDVPSNIQFQVPDHYTKMQIKISDFELGVHGKPTGTGLSFFDAAIKAVDAEVDFAKADMSILVIPGDSNPSLLAVQPWGRGVSNEGQVERVMSLIPNSGAKKLYDSTYAGLQPLGVIHELYHTGIGLDDHYGNESWQPGADLGMGNWGWMSTFKSDLIGWEKWLVGFSSDSQVICVSPEKVSTSWIVPGGVKTTKEKLLLVPISSTKAIAIESIRAAGFNYKMPLISQGALVYTVDTADLRHGYGLSLVVPNGRSIKSIEWGKTFVGDSCPLKIGESVVVDGIKIQVVEAGVFGDVIQVSKAG
jgi:hypothetical protein